MDLRSSQSFSIIRSQEFGNTFDEHSLTRHDWTHNLMCGFAGYLSYSARDVYDETHPILKTMGHLLARRGPDDEQIYQDPYLDFVFRRLSIIDVEGGQQPIWNENQDVFVAVNGEIYNHRQLRSKLRGTRHFRTASDSEILLHLYADYGTEAFQFLNGMFAACIWDTATKTLTLVRDRFGIKPLFLARLEDGLLFGSELKALLAHPKCPREVDWWEVGRTGVEEKSKIATYVKGIEHLPPGHFLIRDEQRLQIDGYWSLAHHLWTPGQVTRDPGWYTDEFTQRIEASVERRLMSDVPVGVFLSGGVDSSLITAVAASKSPGINAFTAVERTTFLAGDVETAQWVAEQTGATLHPLKFEVPKLGAHFDLQTFEAMVALIESPRFEFEWHFKSQMHKYARRAVPDLKVILLGQGADEFAGGYSARHGEGYADWQSYLELEVEPSIRKALCEDLSANSRWQDLLDIQGYPPASESLFSAYQQKMLALCNQLQHFNLWHEDRSSAFEGIEARVPYLDHELVEFLASIPPHLHERLFWDKRIVRDALRKWLPKYPEGKEKIAFYLTRQRESMDDLLRGIVLKIYPEFIERYGDDASEMFSVTRTDRLYLDVKSRRTITDSLWQLLDLMAAVVFQAMVDDVVAFVARAEDHTPALQRVEKEEWPALKRQFEAYRSPPVRSWSLDTTVELNRGVEFLQPIHKTEDVQQVVVRQDGRAADQFTVPGSRDWILGLLHMLFSSGSVSLRELCQRLNQAPDAVASFLDGLVERGYARISTGE